MAVSCVSLLKQLVPRGLSVARRSFGLRFTVLMFLCGEVSLRAVDPLLGEPLFQDRCANCHGGGGITMGASVERLRSIAAGRG